MASSSLPPDRAPSGATVGFTIRPARDGDVAAITRIYSHWVRNGVASYELDPPDDAEMGRRRAAVVARGLPYLVAEDAQGAILGYAYAGPFRARPAFRFTVENSIYVAPDVRRGGIGHALLARLIAACEAAGCRLMVAVIGDPSNEASIALHSRFGFDRAGTLRGCGWKHERWLDTVFMTRALGAGSASAPVERSPDARGQPAE